MTTAGMRFISKVADTGDADAFKRFDLRPEHFPSEDEQKMAEFIADYATRNKGRGPSPEELATEFNVFADEYYAEVRASFDEMASEIKNDWAERAFLRGMQGEGVFNYHEIRTKQNGLDFVRSMREALERIEAQADTSKSIGRNLGQLGIDLREEYHKRKEGVTFKRWDTPFPSLTKEIGGLHSGDVYGIIAESGRGKSYLTIALIDELLRQGAKVLAKSYELKWFLFMSRLVSIATARDEMFTDVRTKRKIGIKNRAILTGELDETSEEVMEAFLARINDYYPGELILQAKSDPELTRSLDDLDRELRAHKDIDVVVIDPFNNISDVYGRNTNKTTGGAAEQAARKFERIVGEHDVLGLFTIQATMEYTQAEKEKMREGIRELKLPTRDQVKTTKAVLEIVTNLFSFDNVDGNARIGTEKGRNGGEGFYVDLIAMLDYGVLREVPSGESIAAQFNADTSIF